jgi:hypothetical protein
VRALLTEGISQPPVHKLCWIQKETDFLIWPGVQLNNESIFEHRKRHRKKPAAGGGDSSPASPNGEFGEGSKVSICCTTSQVIFRTDWKSSALIRPLFHR